MDELQEMREQMAALKEKLNKQEIVNDKLMRRAMRRSLISAKVAGWIGIALFVGLGLALWYMKIAWFADDKLYTRELIFLTPLMICGVLIFVLPMRLVKLKDIRTGTLLDVAKKMRSMNEFYLDERGRTLRLVMLLLLTMYVLFSQEGRELITKNIGLQIICVITVVDIVVSWILYFFPKLRGTLMDRIRLFRRKHHTTEWEEYLRHIEEMSELDEESDKAEKGL